ncbi:TRAP transporter fused permease subunit [Marinomonas rhizomae]|uniref:TRAP transporter 4TM/12TM fusion protein n=1 Tax=Marinomonas rhizomae TaxID=491948 RepID=A0A366J0P1_9GAMM|nr:TRAP transporter fused permease subunit [Marinomonas rhizomae]RBP80512.1 TRAP transporter 4TM/12TM fusion protein [Marinomonas rhizomae]RNF71749.1 TRAP transporter fused permease subunit [Marinomonas rhizomae]
MPSKYFWASFGFISILFHLTLIFSGLVPNLVSRPLHMALALPWAFIFLSNTPLQRYSGYLFTVLGLMATCWVAYNADILVDQYGYISERYQLWIAGILLLSVLEMARRCIGWPLPLVAAIALCYGLFGQYIPGEFGHPGTPIGSFLGTLTIAEGGIWGKLTGVSVSIVAIFVIFGAVLNAGEAGQGFMNLAMAAAGRLRGGAAKVSVISSALFGSISGSASANVASTGAITLPAMTKQGYPKSLAGATEAVASSGGQIMPPLMGAGAFVMVELTGIPYQSIMMAAILPAILYFWAVWIGIDAFALRYDLKAVNKDQQPSRRQLLITCSFFMIPFTILLWGMFGPAFTPQFAASIAIFGAAILLFFNSKGVSNKKQIFERLEDVGVNAGKQIAMIAAIILCASIVVGVLSITGLGVKITSLIISGASGMLWPAIILTAIACLILGMEVPTTAAYVICISVAGPALAQLGLSLIQAHLFVFWFALLSTITPPVCGSVFIAAGMVKENWLKVAGVAMMLGIGLYLIPLAMIANPSLIELGTSPLLAIASGLKIALALYCISMSLIAPFKILKRAFYLSAGLMLIFAFSI